MVLTEVMYNKRWLELDTHLSLLSDRHTDLHAKEVWITQHSYAQSCRALSCCTSPLHKFAGWIRFHVAPIPAVCEYIHKHTANTYFIQMVAREGILFPVTTLPLHVP